jgi:hypothetical protein
MPAEGLAFLISEIKEIPLLFWIASLKLLKKFKLFIYFSKESRELFFLIKLKVSFLFCIICSSMFVIKLIVF